MGATEDSRSVVNRDEVVEMIAEAIRRGELRLVAGKESVRVQ